MTDRDPLHLHPFVNGVLKQHITAAQEHGLAVRLIETWRGSADQEAAKAGGYSKAGAGQSWHNVTYPDGRPCSFAYHLAIVRPGGLLGLGSAPDIGAGLDLAGVKMYEALGLIGQSLGLRWGGNWDRDRQTLEPGENDLMHFELHPNGATLAQTIAAVRAGEQLGFSLPRTVKA